MCAEPSTKDSPNILQLQLSNPTSNISAALIFDPPLPEVQEATHQPCRPQAAAKTGRGHHAIPSI